MSPSPRTFGLVPAAGKSERMGRPKLALPLGERTVLERVVDAVRTGGVEKVLVVVGPHAPELTTVARSAGAEVLLLEEPTTDMRATVERGLRWLQERYHPEADDRWLLLPADHPTLDAGVVRALLQARDAVPERSIVVPAFAGRRGHPALIDWRHVAGIQALAPGYGLNAYLRSQAAQTLELSVVTDDVLLDLDTPEDYEKVVARGAWDVRR